MINFASIGCIPNILTSGGKTAQIILVVGVGMASRFSEPPAFSDPANVAEVYVEEVGHIEIISGVMKLTLTVTRDVGDGAEQVAVCRLVVPLSHVPRNVSAIISAMLGRPFMSSAGAPDTAPN